MRKRILKWLFGTDDVKRYMELLRENIEHGRECRDLINSHLKTLDSHMEDLKIMKKLIIICDNHGIDVDKEIKQIEL